MSEQAGKRHRFSLLSVWRSYRSLPLWVQIWVGAILVPVNGAAFFLMDTWTGVAAAVAAVFVVATNVPIMLIEGGMSRLMAIPHLFAWVPLSVFILGRFFNLVGGPPMSKKELIFAIFLLIVNGISIIFDTIDTVRWCRREREIPGLSKIN